MKLFAEGVVGYGQIRPIAPHHAMSDTYASMIATIKDVCGARLIGRSIFYDEGIHELFDVLTPANFMARAAVDIALYDAMGKATGQPVYLQPDRRALPGTHSAGMVDQHGVRPEEDGGRRRVRAP